MKQVKFFVSMLLLTFLSIVTVGCGGGGGGGASGGINYSGSTELVTIDGSNAVEIATNAYQSASTTNVVAPLGVATMVEKDGDIAIKKTKQLGRPLALAVSQVLEDSLRKINIQGVDDISIASTETGTISGECGGSAPYTLYLDDTTGAFTGTFDFISYCVDGVSVSGVVNVSGNLNSIPATFNFVFVNFTINEGINSYTSAGNINFVINSASQASVSMDMLIKDNTTGKVYWAKNFNISMTAGVSYGDVWITGEYYDPDYGYAVLTTPVAIRLYFANNWPSSGELVVTGNTGIAGGSTKAKLICLSNTTYEVLADTDGNGTYDWSSGVKNWADLQ